MRLTKKHIAKKVAKILISITTLYLILIYAVALLPKEKLIGKRCLPEAIKSRVHDDYFLPGTTWIPFYMTSWCFVEPPILILGNQKSRVRAVNDNLGPQPVPNAGEWQISFIRIKNNWPLFLPYLALTTGDNIHFRAGCRWDNINHYYVFPSLSLKRVSIKNSR